MFIACDSCITDLIFILFFAAAMQAPPVGLSLPNNPGTIEELHRRCQAIFPMNFEGSKLIVNKGLSSHFQVAHNMTIGSDPKSTGYKFGATYVGTKMLSPSEVTDQKLYDLIEMKMNPSFLILRHFH